MRIIPLCLAGIIVSLALIICSKLPPSPVIVLLGAPFSGKGTQADLLKMRLNVPILQSGDLFRNESKSGSERGVALVRDDVSEPQRRRLAFCPKRHSQ